MKRRRHLQANNKKEETEKTKYTYVRFNSL